GKVVVRGKATIEDMKGNREQIIINEIPYDVNKAALVRKMDELNADRKVDGIADIRDESDRNGLRIVIDLRKGADSESVLNFSIRIRIYKFYITTIWLRSKIKHQSYYHYLMYSMLISTIKKMLRRVTPSVLSEAQKKEHISVRDILNISRLDVCFVKQSGVQKHGQTMTRIPENRIISQMQKL